MPTFSLNTLRLFHIHTDITWASVHGGHLISVLQCLGYLLPTFLYKENELLGSTVTQWSLGLVMSGSSLLSSQSTWPLRVRDWGKSLPWWVRLLCVFHGTALHSKIQRRLSRALVKCALSCLQRSWVEAWDPSQQAQTLQLPVALKGKTLLSTSGCLEWGMLGGPVRTYDTLSSCWHQERLSYPQAEFIIIYSTTIGQHLPGAVGSLIC